MDKEQNTMNLFDCVDQNSFTQGSSGRFIRIVAYSTLAIIPPRKIFKKQIGKCSCFLFLGTLDYFPEPEGHLYSDGKGIQLRPVISDDKIIKSPNGIWLVLVIPYDNMSKPAAMLEDELVGIFSIYFGANYAYEVFFRNEYTFENKTLKLYEKVFDSPYLMTREGIDESSLNIFSGLVEKISELDTESVNIILSCIRWYSKATSKPPVEGFIFLWTALEVIGKNGTQDLGLLKKKLSEMYGTSKDKIEETFYIGHLESFRGKVLHSGFDFPINPAILHYLRSLIEDLVIFYLTKTNKGRSLEYIKKLGPQIKKSIEAY